MDAGHFTTLAKDPSLQGKNSRNGTFAPDGAPARASLLQGRKPPTKELFRLSKALENGRITRNAVSGRGEIPHWR